MIDDLFLEVYAEEGLLQGFYESDGVGYMRVVLWWSDEIAGLLEVVFGDFLGSGWMGSGDGRGRGCGGADTGSAEETIW